MKKFLPELTKEQAAEWSKLNHCDNCDDDVPNGVNCYIDVENDILCCPKCAVVLGHWPSDYHWERDE